MGSQAFVSTGEESDGGEEEESGDGSDDDDGVVDNIGPTQLTVEKLSVLSRRVCFSVSCRAKNNWGHDSHGDTYDSAFSFGQMKGVLNEADMGRLKAYPLDDALEMLSTDLALTMNIAAYLTQEANCAGEMEKRHALELEKVKEEALRVVREKEQLLERYTREMKTGKKFMESETGKAAFEEAVNKFKDSKEFEELVLDRADGIYEQTVQDCRKILQGTGRVSKEDLLLLDPGLPLNFTRDGRIVGAGDAEDGADRDDLPPRLSVLFTSFVFLCIPVKSLLDQIQADLQLFIISALVKGLQSQTCFTNFGGGDSFRSIHKIKKGLPCRYSRVVR
ncbi:hypothetical protein CDL12_19303 [Handroanthus impetiginosus]|uniref:Uncharacterized protein n=1 Tax=Handroanthus impetiginosus TaxID=429701 RepID=A0A2G9GS42_9LAMI|nr:hypothetical protein CDL12_19303 [Handroanthus impetiginosus]